MREFYVLFAGILMFCVLPVEASWGNGFILPFHITDDVVNSEYSVFLPEGMQLAEEYSEPSFRLDTAHLSCYGSNDGIISAIASYDGQVEASIDYTVVEGLVTNQAGLNSATVVTSQPMSEKLDIVVRNLESGVYTIAALDMNGILHYLPFEVSSPDEINVEISSPRICAGNEAVIAPVSIEGRLPSDLLFQWEAQNNSGEWDTLHEKKGTECRLQLFETVTIRLLASDGTCADTAESQILVKPVPVFNMPVKPICEGSVAVITAPGGMDSYSWSTGESDDGKQSVHLSQAGDYSVSVSKDGCLNDTVFSLVVNPIPPAGLENEYHFCEQGTITVPFKYDRYRWSDNQMEQSLLVTASGVYTVTVTDNICESSEKITVTVDTLPVFMIADTAVCEGQKFDYPLPATYRYELNGKEIIETLSVSDEGEYRLSVINGACRSEKAFSVKEKKRPDIDLGNRKVFCDSAVLDAAVEDCKYKWSTGDTAKTIVAESSGVYSLTASYDGCVSYSEIAIKVYHTPEFDLGNDTAICEGDTIVLDAQWGADNYEWNTGAVGPAANSIVVADSGWYAVTVTVGSGSGSCTAVAKRHISLQQRPELVIHAPAEICEGDTAQLSVKGAESYIWNTGDSIDLIYNVINETSLFTVKGWENGCISESEHIVVCNPLPVVEASPRRRNLCVADSTDIFVNTDAEQVLWSEGLGRGVKHTVSPVQNTVYYVTGIRKACSLTDSVMVFTKPDIIGGPKTDTAICRGGSIKLTAAGNNALSYEWDNGLPGDSVFVLTPQKTTTYHVTAYFNGCSVEDQLTVEVNTLPDVKASASKTEICAGEEVYVSAEGAEYYSWGNVQHKDFLSVPMVDTIYSVIGRDTNDCVNHATVAVKVNPHPLPKIVTQSEKKRFCEGDTVKLALADSFARYKWSNSSELSAIEIDSLGINTYWVTVEDSNACKAVDSIQVEIVPLPVFDLGEDVVRCANEIYKTELNVTGAEYKWSTGSNANVAVLYPSANPLLWVEVTAGGCTSLDSMHVTFTDLPDYELLGDSAIYKGDSVFLQVSRKFASFMWNTGENRQFIEQTTNPDSPSKIDYWVMVTDEYNCRKGDTIDIDLYTLPQLELNDISLCTGESGTIEANSGFDSYVWSNGSIGQNIDVTETGNYKLAASRYFPPIVVYDTVSVTVHPLPVFELGNDLQTCDYDSLKLEVISEQQHTYLWSNGERSSSISPQESGAYSVTVASEFGCRQSDTVNLDLKSVPDAPQSADFTFCVGEKLDAVYVAGESLHWFDISGIQIHTGNAMPAVADSAFEASYGVTQTINGCVSDTARVKLKIVEPQFSVDIAGDEEVCVPEFGHLYQAKGLTSDVSWEFYSLNDEIRLPVLSAENFVNVDFGYAGQYLLIAQATDSNACLLSDTLTVFASSGPEVAFDYFIDPENYEVQFYNQTELNELPGSGLVLKNTYKWDFGRPGDVPLFVEGDTVIAYEYGDYSVNLLAIDDFGCTSAVSYEIFMSADCRIFVPNALSPDHASARVACFMPEALNLSEYEIWVYDSWGNTVWYSNKIENGQPAECWDGTNQGQPLPFGSYWWQIKAQFINGQSFKEFGDLYMVK